MHVKAIAFTAAVLFSVTASQQAMACKFVQPPTQAARINSAKDAVSRASVIIDAEVIRAYKSEAEPALLKVNRLIKGPRGKQVFTVAGGTSCDNQFAEVGARQRVLLYGGPKIYTAPMYVSTAEEINRAIGMMARRKR
jgi:hypothetical protein